MEMNTEPQITKDLTYSNINFYINLSLLVKLTTVNFVVRFRCSNDSTPDAKLTIPFYNGELRADHLYHQHSQDTLPPQQRYYKIEASVNGTTKELASTNTFTISSKAK